MSGDKKTRPLCPARHYPRQKPNYIERRKGCKGAKGAVTRLSLSFWPGTAAEERGGAVRSIRAVAMPDLPPAAPVRGRAKLYRFRGIAK